MIILCSFSSWLSISVFWRTCSPAGAGRARGWAGVSVRGGVMVRAHSSRGPRDQTPRLPPPSPLQVRHAHLGHGHILLAASSADHLVKGKQQVKCGCRDLLCVWGVGGGGDCWVVVCVGWR